MGDGYREWMDNMENAKITAKERWDNDEMEVDDEIDTLEQYLPIAAHDINVMFLEDMVREQWETKYREIWGKLWGL